MVCPRCGNPSPEGTPICAACGTPFAPGDATLPLPGEPDPDATVAMQAETSGWSRAATMGEYVSTAPLQPGAVLAGRYEILKLLGEGGMGAVYRAQDRQLERVVALKVIRPELARNAEMLRRFKEELKLARQVAHRNIIRIFDLGHAEGMRFITMEYIEGEDVAQILARRGTLPAAEAAAIVGQVARGLEAAHAGGVVHRDLKPQNIMLDGQGKASVMDFGIARSMESTGATRTGALLGTPAYMSPEQAQGHKVDSRSDLYSLGIIFYELLTGKPPFEADTLMGTLMRRIQETAPPPNQIEPSIPKAINDMVLKMLRTKVEDRYQSAREIITDLDEWEANRTGRTLTTGPVKPQDGIPLKYVAAAMVFLFAIGTWLYTRKPAGPTGTAATPRIVRVLVGDFQNSTGEAVLDGTMEPMVALALEGAGFVNAYSRGDARKTARQLQPGAAHLDEKLALLVAGRDGIQVVVSGAILASGGGYQVRARALDAGGRIIAEESVSAGSKPEVLTAAVKLAAPIRKALGDTTAEAVQLRAAAAYRSRSLEAAQAYARGVELEWDGRNAEAIPFFQKAVEGDPEMGRAYAGLAAADRATGASVEAGKYFQIAIWKIASMTEREQYRIRGAYYLFQRNDLKAVEEFKALTRRFPADGAGHINLAAALSHTLDFKGALAEGQRAIEIDNTKALYRSDTARYALYAGQFDTAIHGAADAIQLDPSAEAPYVTTALSLFAQGKTAEAADAYGKLERVGARGASLASIGLADLALYEGRNTDAAAILEKGIAADLAANQATSAAVKLAALADARRKGPKAIEAANRALATDPDGAPFAAAKALLDNGQEARVLAIARGMSGGPAADRRAYAKEIEGELELWKGKPQAAIDLFQEAKKLSDTWLSHFDLGRAYIDAGAFIEASSEFDACEKRKGEAADVFLDTTPSFRYFPLVYYYRARAQEGMKSSAAAQSYKTFLDIKSRADAGDPAVADALRRAKALGVPGQ